MLYYLRKKIKNEDGSVATIIGLSIIGLMVVIGVTIDMGRYFLVRNKILTALDSALLAASSITTRDMILNNPGEIENRGRQFFRANFPANYLGTNIDDSDIVITADANTGAISGEVNNASMPLVFAGIFNLSGGAAAAPGININVFSEVLRQVDASLEIALVLDYTPSMCFRLNTGSMWGVPRVADPSCAKFNAMKQASVDFITAIDNAINVGNVTPTSRAYYSFVPFSHSVRVNNSLQNFNYCFAANQTNMPSIAGLSGDSLSIINKIKGQARTSTEGGSNIATAMWWGWASLRPTEQNLFVGSSAKNAPAETPAGIDVVNNRGVNKILLLLTDGQNEYPNRDCENGLRILSGDEQGFQRDLVADDRFAQLCEAAKAEGVTVYTIAFNVPDSPTVTTRSLLNACASEDGAYNADDTAQLQEVFGQIANDVIGSRITK